MNEKVLIVGAGMGLSASIARLCSSEGMEVALAARNIDKLVSLKKEINAKTFKCDASDINEVSSLFRELDQSFGIPNLVIYLEKSPFVTKLSAMPFEPAHIVGIMTNTTCYRSR